MRNNWFVQGLITRFVWYLLSLGGGVVVAVLSKRASAWAQPALYGLAAFAIMSVGIWAIRTNSRLPRARALPTVDNIESLVRVWLDNFKYAVKSDPIPDAFFRFIITTDAGKILTVGRPRGGLSGYLLIRSDITLSPEEQKIFANPAVVKAQRTLSQFRLKLARAKVGYSGLAIPLTSWAIIKRLPISESLTEDSFVAKLEEMEAVLNAIGEIWLMALNEIPGGPRILPTSQYAGIAQPQRSESASATP